MTNHEQILVVRQQTVGESDDGDIYEYGESGVGQYDNILGRLLTFALRVNGYCG